MKKSFAMIALLVGLFSSVVHAYPAGSTAYLKLSNTGISSTAYTTLTSSLIRPVGSMTIWSGSTVPLQFAVGPAGSEVPFFTMPANTGSPSSQQLPSLPVVIPAGSRVSVISLTAPSSSGDLEVNFFFN